MNCAKSQELDFVFETVALMKVGVFFVFFLKHDVHELYVTAPDHPHVSPLPRGCITLIPALYSRLCESHANGLSPHNSHFISPVDDERVWKALLGSDTSSLRLAWNSSASAFHAHTSDVTQHELLNQK